MSKEIARAGLNLLVQCFNQSVLLVLRRHRAFFVVLNRKRTMDVKLSLIYIDIKHLYPFVDPGNKLPLNFFQRNGENCSESIAYVHGACKAMDKRFEHFKPIALDNELNH